jgi:hypothetical protein
MHRSRRALAAGLLGAAITAFVLLAAQPGVALLCAMTAAGMALLPQRNGIPARAQGLGSAKQERCAAAHRSTAFARFCHRWNRSAAAQPRV